MVRLALSRKGFPLPCSAVLFGSVSLISDGLAHKRHTSSVTCVAHREVIGYHHDQPQHGEVGTLLRHDRRMIGPLAPVRLTTDSATRYGSNSFDGRAHDRENTAGIRGRNRGVLYESLHGLTALLLREGSSRARCAICANTAQRVD